MSTIKNIILLLLPVLFFSSCFKDLGNYEYVEINEVEFEDVEPSYTAMLGEHFTLRPTLVFTKDEVANANDTSKYSYDWTAIRLDGALPADAKKFLATTRNLDQPITIPPGPYRVFYVVKDKTTGVTWQKTFLLTVISSVYEGWFVLNDVAGSSRLDMISRISETEERLIYDVLDFTGSTVPREGKPKRIYCYNFDPQFYGIYLTTEISGTNKIQPESFEWNNTYNISYEFLSNVTADVPVTTIQSNGGNSSYLISGTDIYYYYRVFQIRYDVPINLVQGELTPFKAAPFIAPGIFGASILYDAENRRFLRHVSGSAKATLMPGPGEFFENNNTGMDLVYMHRNPRAPNGNDETFCIMKEPDNENYFLVRFNASLAQIYFQPMPATDIHLAENFSVSPDLGYIFYNVGSKVYEYEFSLKESKLMLDLAPKQISFMGFHKFESSRAHYADVRKQLIIATVDPALTEGSNGKMDFYSVPPVQGPLNLEKSYDGFGKIVSIGYRER